VARVRRLAVVRPIGLRNPVEVNELLPPATAYPQLTDAHIADYEAGLSALVAGDWPAAMEHLHAVPANDQAKDFLTVFIARHNRTAPDDWDGVIPLAEKS
jgi:adenylate cyclase